MIVLLVSCLVEPRLCVGLCQLIACNRFAAAVANAGAAAVICQVSGFDVLGQK